MSDNQKKLEQQFSDWLQHPMTKYFMDWVRQGIKDDEDAWSSGAYTDQSQWGTAIKNAEAIGRCGLAKTILSIELKQLEDRNEE